MWDADSGFVVIVALYLPAAGLSPGAPICDDSRMTALDGSLFGGDRREKHDVVGVVGVASVDEHRTEPVATWRRSVVDECATQEFEEAASLVFVAGHEVEREMSEDSLAHGGVLAGLVVVMKLLSEGCLRRP